MATARKIVVLREERTTYKTHAPAPSDTPADPPFSCSTNLSNDVLEQLRRHKLGAAAWNVCAYIHRRTFGDAGLQRKKRQREPGLWCDFSVAEWAREVPSDPDVLVRIRRRLEACHIIVFEAGERQGTGRVGWNIHFDEWLRYDTRGGARSGSGAPQGNQNARKTALRTINTTTDDGTEINQYDNRKTINKSDENNQNVGGDSINTSEETINKSENTIKTSERAAPRRRNEAARSGAEEYINNSPYGENEESVTNVTERSASADAPTSTTQRKRSADHEWRMNCLERVKSLRDGGVYNQGRDWKAAGDLFKRGADIDDIVDLWQTEARRPKHQSGEELTLFDISRCYGPWIKSRANYRVSVERSIKAANGEYDTPPSRAAPAQRPQQAQRLGPAPIVTA